MRNLNVIPIAPGEKRPLEKDWQFNTLPMSEAAARWPGSDRWGAPAGPVNGHWVWDEDGAVGLASTRALEAEFGPLPRTLTVRTPRGGRHFWFRWRDDRPIKNKVGILPGIDLRGPGGQSLIPPSSGYSWEDETAPLADAPDWLYERILEQQPPAEPVSLEKPPYVLVDREGAMKDAATWPPAVQGENGSAMLFGLALRLTRGRGLSAPEAVTLIQGAYNDRCVPPWSTSEIRHKVDDAIEKGQAPWGYTFYHGTLPEVLRRALPKYGPAGHLDACVPYLVAPDGTMQQTDSHNGLANAVLHVVRAMNGTCTTKEAWDIVRWWNVQVEPTDLFPPALVLNDAPGPSLVRLSVRPGETPAWDEFLGRLSCPETFLAWVWMLTLPIVTRQVLWIQGAGHDGKTQVSTALKAMFGAAGTTCTDDFLENSARWLGAQIYGKRLVVADDTKMRQVLRRGVVHRVTGRSGMKMEMKGKEGFDFTPNCAILCTSNYTPFIGRGRADRTRLLPLTVSGDEHVSDTAWGERLKAELPALLAKAQAAYERLATAPGEPQLRHTEPVRQALNVAAGVDSRTYTDRLETAGLCLDPAKSITGNELFNRLHVAGASGEWHEFREWLEEQGVRVDHTEKGSLWTGLGSIR